MTKGFGSPSHCLRLGALLAAGCIFMACGSSKFSGTPNTLAPKPTSAVGQPKGVTEEVMPKAPDNAVVKGSFTAYTEPKIPKPNQAYTIFIKIRLPSGAAANYKKEDLAIQMKGTDGYIDTFPQNAAPTPGSVVKSEAAFSIVGDEVTVQMRIPGAKANVKDTILAKSLLLGETQTLELVFTADSIK